MNEAVAEIYGIHETHGCEWYEKNLVSLKRQLHSRCIFNRRNLIDNLHLCFNDKGILGGHFSCSGAHEGYDSMAHGGIIAAIIDASMTQCLMGHGIAAYTARLDIRYRAPLRIEQKSDITTAISDVTFNKLYHLITNIVQNGRKSVTAKAAFCRIDG
jgi:hypothetical protein